MRLWHLTFAVLVIAVLLVCCRDPAGRVAVVVFFTATGEVVFGLTAVMALFQTLGAFGHAKGLYAHAEAALATTVVLFLGTALMAGCLFIGAWLVQAWSV